MADEIRHIQCIRDVIGVNGMVAWWCQSISIRIGHVASQSSSSLSVSISARVCVCLHYHRQHGRDNKRVLVLCVQMYTVIVMSVFCLYFRIFFDYIACANWV